MNGNLTRNRQTYVCFQKTLVGLNFMGYTDKQIYGLR
jgi:hypothetical protein